MVLLSTPLMVTFRGTVVPEARVDGSCTATLIMATPAEEGTAEMTVA